VVPVWEVNSIVFAPESTVSFARLNESVAGSQDGLDLIGQQRHMPLSFYD
jgi:hypothetical protein